MNDAPAIPRLGVPAYNWWNEALHAVRPGRHGRRYSRRRSAWRRRSTCRCDPLATAIAEEGRAKHHEFGGAASAALSRMTSGRQHQHLPRPALGPRQETYGEDPYLTSRDGLPSQGAAGRRPEVLKTVATAKHYSAQRTEAIATPSTSAERARPPRDLPAPSGAGAEGKVASVMGAYNRVYGESASAARASSRPAAEGLGFRRVRRLRFADRSTTSSSAQIGKTAKRRRRWR